MAKKQRSRVRKATIKPLRPGMTAAGDVGTTQPEDEESFTWTPNDSVPPPESLDALAKLTTLNRVRRSCIAAIVTNTVGLGYQLVPAEGAEDQVNDKVIQEASQKIEACAFKDEKLHNPTFTQQISAVKWDEQEVGNGYLEISRNRLTGEVSGFFHVIGKRARRTGDRTGWVVGRRDDPLSALTRFVDFGKKVIYDDDGKPTAKLADGATRWDINELIPFQLYTSESRDYGLPPDAQLAIDYLGDKNAADANASFFDGSGVPPTVIFVSMPEDTGEEGDDGFVEMELDSEVVTAIGDTLRAGNDHYRRVAIVPLPPGSQVNAEQLAQRADRDIGFVEFRKDNRRAALGAYRLAPIFVADIEDTNYATAETERAVTKEQVFDPEQQRTGDILTKLLADLGFPMLQFKFMEMEVEGIDKKAERADAMADHKTITRKEYRAAHGYEPLPEAQGDGEPQNGEMPSGWNDELVDPSTGGAVVGVPPDIPEVPPGEVTDPTLDQIIKSGTPVLMEDAVDQAINRVQEMVPGMALKPVVLTKDGDSIVVAPYGGANGDGPDA
jgi:phage portal protein BeeE